MLARSFLAHPLKSMNDMKMIIFSLGFLAQLWVPLAADQLPNIVILYADDMGFGDLGANNPASKIPTPNLDKLAAEGMRFTDAHSSSAICTPSRYALLTGRFHWRKFHGIVQSFGGPSFDEKEMTLPEMLKTKGYRTACIGKWHLGWNWQDIRKPRDAPADVNPKRKSALPIFSSSDFDWSMPVSGGPLSHGFDYYFGDDVPNFPPYAWFENDRVITEPTVPLHIDSNTKEGHWEARPGPMVAGWDFYQVVPTLGQRAVKWIGEQKGKKSPFFLYLPFNSPHAPIVPNDEFIGKSMANGFGDFVVQTDSICGDVLKALKDHGFAENTIVVFSSDNGPEAYAFERIRKCGHDSTGSLRGLKRDLYEGGHRVPFIVRWPKKVRPGSVHDGLFSQVDLMATFAAVVGFDLLLGQAEDSHNQLAAWTEGQPSARTEIVHNTSAGAYAMRQGDWVLILNPANAQGYAGSHHQVPDWYAKQKGYRRSNGTELYHLASDLGQMRDLREKHPDKLKHLKARLQAIQAKGQLR